LREENCGRSNHAKYCQICCNAPRRSAGGFEQKRGDHWRQAAAQSSGELVAGGGAAEAHGGWKQFAEEGGLRSEHGGDANAKAGDQDEVDHPEFAQFDEAEKRERERGH
jgi:hypothetical protein